MVVQGGKLCGVTSRNLKAGSRLAHVNVKAFLPGPSNDVLSSYRF